MKINYSLPLGRILHERYGFLILPSSPTKQDQEEYERVCRLLDRTDLPFTPSVSVLYERQLSLVTSLVIEGAIVRTETGVSLGYHYDFYKVRHIGSSEPQAIKMYCTKVKRRELLQVIQRFNFLVEGDNKDE